MAKAKTLTSDPSAPASTILTPEATPAPAPAPSLADQIADAAKRITTAASLRQYALATLRQAQKRPRIDAYAALKSGFDPSTLFNVQKWQEWHGTTTAMLSVLRAVAPGVNYQAGRTNVTGDRAASAILREDSEIIRSFK